MVLSSVVPLIPEQLGGDLFSYWRLNNLTTVTGCEWEAEYARNRFTEFSQTLLALTIANLSVLISVGALTGGRLICVQWPAVTSLLSNPDGLVVVDHVSLNLKMQALANNAIQIRSQSLNFVIVKLSMVKLLRFTKIRKNRKSFPLKCFDVYGN